MKKYFLLLLLILIFFAFGFSESIKFVSSIEIGSVKKNKKLTKVLFGKKINYSVKPASVFFINDNYLGVTDQIYGKIIILNRKGQIIKKIGRINKMNLQSPVCGSSDMEGGFYISDSQLRLIARFSSSFKFKNFLISDPSRRITGIFCFDKKVFCTDTKNHKVLVISEDGKILVEFGKRGISEGEFNFPTHLTVDNDNIYVNDALNFRVQIFDHKGKFRRMFGKKGKNGGEFSQPKGIAVDSKKRIFVTDVIFDNVQVFNIQGRFLSYFGGPGSSDGEFWMPSGLSIDQNDLIYIADTYNNRLQIYKVVKGEK